MQFRANWIRVGQGAAVGLLLYGCFSSSVAKDKHAEFYGCKSDEVTLEEVEVAGETQYRTRGCGHEDTFVCMAAKCRSPHQLVIRHFSNDTGCAHDQVSAKGGEGDSWKVSGCSKKATYRCVDDDKQLIRCERQ